MPSPPNVDQGGLIFSMRYRDNGPGARVLAKLKRITLAGWNQNTPQEATVIADEILVQFGKEVVYNTFEQNRIFLGIKQNITPRLSFDFGYMNVYQQKSSGYQYDMNHTMRLFFYYNTGWKKGNKPTLIESGDE